MDQDQVDCESSATLALLGNDINKILRCIEPMVNKLEDLGKRVEFMETKLKIYQKQQEDSDEDPSPEKPSSYDPNMLIPTFPEEFNRDVFCKWVKEVELYFECRNVRWDRVEHVVASLPQDGEVSKWWKDIQELGKRVNLWYPMLWTDMKRLLMHKFLCP